MSRLVLRSSNSDVTVEFSDFDGNDFRVAVRAHDHSATRSVYAYRDGPGIAQLFAEAARECRGWDGVKSWQSVDNELRLELTVDRFGHVVLGIQVRSDGGIVDAWELEAHIGLEVGQLEAIAREAEGVFSGR